MLRMWKANTESFYQLVILLLIFQEIKKNSTRYQFINRNLLAGFILNGNPFFARFFNLGEVIYTLSGGGKLGYSFLGPAPSKVKAASKLIYYLIKFNYKFLHSILFSFLSFYVENNLLVLLI